MTTFYNLLNELAELAPSFCSKSCQPDKEGHTYNVWRLILPQPGRMPDFILQYDSECSRDKLAESDMKNLAHVIKTQLILQGWTFSCWYRPRPVTGKRCWEVELCLWGEEGSAANFHEATGDSEAECFLSVYVSHLRSLNV